jgi:hypothetical protein
VVGDVAPENGGPSERLGEDRQRGLRVGTPSPAPSLAPLRGDVVDDVVLRPLHLDRPAFGLGRRPHRHPLEGHHRDFALEPSLLHVREHTPMSTLGPTDVEQRTTCIPAAIEQDERAGQQPGHASELGRDAGRDVPSTSFRPVGMRADLRGCTCHVDLPTTPTGRDGPLLTYDFTEWIGRQRPGRDGREVRGARPSAESSAALARTTPWGAGCCPPHAR